MCRKLFKTRNENHVLWILATEVLKDEPTKGVGHEAVWRHAAVLPSAMLPRVVNQHMLLFMWLWRVLLLVPKQAALKFSFSSLHDAAAYSLRSWEPEPRTAGFRASWVTARTAMGAHDMTVCQWRGEGHRDCTGPLTTVWQEAGHCTGTRLHNHAAGSWAAPSQTRGGTGRERHACCTCLQSRGEGPFPFQW